MLQLKDNSLSRIDKLRHKQVILSELSDIASGYNIGVSSPFLLSSRVVRYLIDFNQKSGVFSDKALTVLEELFLEDAVAVASHACTAGYLNHLVNSLWAEEDNFKNIFFKLIIEERIEIIPLRRASLSLSNYSSALLRKPDASVTSIEELLEKRSTLCVDGQELVARFAITDQKGYKSVPVGVDTIVLRTLFSKHQVYNSEHDGGLKSPNKMGITPGLLAKVVGVLQANGLICFVDQNFHAVYLSDKGRDLLSSNYELIGHLECILNTMLSNKSKINFEERHCSKTGDWMSVWNDKYVADLLLYLSYLDNKLNYALQITWRGDSENVLLVNPSHEFGEYGARRQHPHFTPICDINNNDPWADASALAIDKLLYADVKPGLTSFMVLNLIARATASL